MIIKNIGHKIINVGSTAIMPDEAMSFPGTLKNNPSLRAMAARGYISMTSEATDEADITKKEETDEVVKAQTPTPQDLMFEQSTEFTAAPSPTAATTIRGKKVKAKQDEENANSASNTTT